MKFKLFPYTKFMLKKIYSELILNLLNQSSIKCESKFVRDNLEIFISSKYRKKVIDLLNKNNIEILSVSEVGILGKTRKLNRLGLILGIFLIIFSVFVSSKVVWKINVDGNEQLSDDVVIKMLNDCGFYYGKFIPSIKYDKLHNEILLKNKEISWVSINIDGNVATVLIKESETSSSSEEYYSNIVAKSDAQIIQVKVTNGEQVVKVNDIVKEGELLISGIIDSQSQGVRYENAKGEVLARTSHKILVEFPYIGKEKIYTGRVVTDKKIKIFSKVINFSSKNNKKLELYDKIENNKQITLFGKYKLPIFVESTQYFEYQMVDKQFSKREAVDLSFKELKSRIESITFDAELISKSIETSFDENGFYIICKVECIEDIAKEVRIYKK